ncbi:MAG TPA: chemotaxis protein CheB [Verrucomicrobiae bacterium]|nr:chemotaxis protein CheB [Verrucomicrobiae bacterium]
MGAGQGGEAGHPQAAKSEVQEAAATSRINTHSSDGNKPFLIVGVGASAGGLEAFSKLLENLPTDTGMAFVLVQHLDPSHASSLTHLLSPATSMLVRDIQDATVVEANHVYVIPPDRSLEIAGGVLYLTPRKEVQGPNLPIDRFFRSLAMDQGNAAVGIVLSGNGVDGTEGLQEIKAEGGITFAQEERSAKFGAMPGSAVRAGCVDFVMSPGNIARELKRISQAAPRARIEELHAPQPEMDADLTRIFSLLRSATGVDFTFYKVTTLKRRILRRIVLRRMSSLQEYLRHLQKNPAEVDLLFNDILIKVTGFFRDPQVFAALKKKVLPGITKNKNSEIPIRIWVPGCSTGEEVYSLAICLHEFLGKNVSGKQIQIFGTDISDAIVARARIGLYSSNISAQVSPERLRRYFVKVEDGYQIAKFIRDLCIFARQNVAEDPPFSKLDLISCRNLLIYLGPELQRKVMPTFHYSLRSGGFLMLGTSETVGSFATLFSVVDKKNKIYCKVENHSRPDLEFFPSPSPEISQNKPARLKEDLSPLDLQRRADDILLSQYAPAGVVVNSRLEVLHFRGRTGYYMEPAPGTASLNLLKMAREELIIDIRTAFAQASKTRLPVRKHPVRIRYNGHYREVGVEVVPFKTSPSSVRFFLVLFHDVIGVQKEEKGRRAKVPKAQQLTEREIQRLRKEINHTRESLQTIIEEQEVTNEELKSANEEIQSSNEELQSTNEELETAKEELQSSNEELTTLNEELQNRNVELSQANNDLNNLLGSFNMPMLMLDNDLALRRFTPLAERLFNLIPADVGRRISDINPNITVPRLDRIVSEVIDSLIMREIDVQDKEGHWYSMRIRPYRTSENRIQGAVIVLVDIGDIRQAIDEITEMTSDPMLILNEELVVAKANDNFLLTFGLSREETEAKGIFEMRNSRWNIPALRSLLTELLPENKRAANRRVDILGESGEPSTFMVAARRIYQQSKGTHYVVVRFGEATTSAASLSQ